MCIMMLCFPAGFDSVIFCSYSFLNVVQSTTGMAATSLKFLLFFTGRDRNVSEFLSHHLNSQGPETPTAYSLSPKLNWEVTETCDNQTELPLRFTSLFESLKCLEMWAAIQRCGTKVTETHCIVAYRAGRAIKLISVLGYKSYLSDLNFGAYRWIFWISDFSLRKQCYHPSLFQVVYENIISVLRHW